MTDIVAIHPEAVDDSTDLRWVMPAGTVGFVGPVGSAPAAVQQLLDEGVLAALVMEPVALRTTLGPNRSWRIEGARVRTVLQHALAQPDEWSPVTVGTPDDVLRAAVDEVLAGDVGRFIASHGGGLRVLDIADRVITLELQGACAHCPASEVTLTDRFESAVRERFPALRAVRTAAPPAMGAGRKLLGIMPVNH
ncbi:NifU family protein [Williamsia sp. CHRR-6]|uniref:NifU family protein n=1 Tax=Williamsia sp. CHRR-6 TaxID=2835871 RepID=UPI001BDA4184|nr:NifU family protein [Williamsia sp. CHRR-6]MBT0567607.1 NifU family protein [Williamsia sp. CHRR-6]